MKMSIKVIVFVFPVIYLTQVYMKNEIFIYSFKVLYILQDGKYCV